MPFIEFIKIFFFGVIEGITEWLPVSSTGHLILFNYFFPIKSVSEGFMDMFEYVIQLAAILAVVVLFWKQIFPLGKQTEEGKSQIVWKKDVLSLWVKIIIACVPALFALLIDPLFEKLSPVQEAGVVSITLILYGIVFLVVERWNKKESKVQEVCQISYSTAFFIGCFQLLATIPGTSRSGITIIGALLLGVSRKASAEFTFFLAIPTMVGASGYKILKFLLDSPAITGAEVGALALGCVVAFTLSLVSIRFLMNFVKKHDFKPFGFYRIALGILVLGIAVIPNL